MGDFAGLQLALSSLYAQRKAIDVTGQNIANVNTDGYSRQRVHMTADAGPVMPARFSIWTGAGGGVRSDTIERIRDQFLQLRGFQEHAAGQNLDQIRNGFTQLEAAVNEPSDTAIGAQLSSFWAAWDDVANRPSDLAARSQLVQRAQTLVSSFSQTDAAMATQQSQGIVQISAIIQDTNSIAARVAQLNQTIQSAVQTGLTPNDLMDQRDNLINMLSENVGVTVRPGQFQGTVDVYVDGTAIVRGSTAQTLTSTTNPNPPNNQQILWTTGTNVPVNVGGKVGGLLTTINSSIPTYRTMLSNVANQLMTQTNAVHATGFDLQGNAGVPFFVSTPTGVAVNPAIAADLTLVAASGSATGTLDGSVAQQLALLGQSNAANPTADDNYRQMVTQLGVDSQSAMRRADIQATVVKQVDGAMESDAGVNLDEEMTNLVQFQQAYSAASKYLSVVDQTLDALLNIVR